MPKKYDYTKADKLRLTTDDSVAEISRKTNIPSGALYKHFERDNVLNKAIELMDDYKVQMLASEDMKKIAQLHYMEQIKISLLKTMHIKGIYKLIEEAMKEDENGNVDKEFLLDVLSKISLRDLNNVEGELESRPRVVPNQKEITEEELNNCETVEELEELKKEYDKEFVK